MVLKHLFCVSQTVTTALEEEEKGKEEITKRGRNYPRFIEPGVCGSGIPQGPWSADLVTPSFEGRFKQRMAVG